jgi:HSP20 family molecular chaperone IbpA
LLHEYGVGDFYRTFRVSQQVDASRITAEYENGVLTLHLPKAEAARPRKIEVQAR